MTSDQQHGDDAAQFDALAQDGPPQRAFLRSRWFDASPAPPDRIVLRGEEGMALAALGLAMRRRGPFRLREIAGSYWPFRGVPLLYPASPTPQLMRRTPRSPARAKSS